MTRWLIVLALWSATTSAQSPPLSSAVTFEAASIRLAAAGTKRASPPAVEGRRLMMSNVPIRTLIYYAYSPIEGREIVGGPRWVHEDPYTIEAVAARPITPDEARAMARQLLTERFNLSVKYEKQPRPILSMELADASGKLHAGLERSTEDCDAFLAKMGADRSLLGTVASNGGPLCTSMGGAQIVSGGITMDALAALLTPRTDAIVRNRTGLTGRYVFTLRFSRQLDAAATSASDAPPALPTALREQLGLRLVAGEEPLEVLVIESITRPSDN